MTPLIIGIIMLAVGLVGMIVGWFLLYKTPVRIIKTINTK